MSSDSKSLAADRLAILSRQLVVREQGRTGGDIGGESNSIFSTPTFSTSTSTSASPPPPPTTVVVLGGCVMDVVARASPGFSLSRGGSVPGSVRLTPGGVGYNIAVALAGLLLSPLPLPPLLSSSRSPRLLPRPRVSIISVVGSDPAGDALVSSLETAGVDASGVGRLVAASEGNKSGGGSEAGATAATAAMTTSTPVVVAIHEAGTGDVAASVADVAAVESSFTPELVEKELSRTGRENAHATVAVVVDGNLSAAAVAAAASSSSASASSSSSSSSNSGISLFEPVSVAKGVRAVKGGKLRCRVMTPNAAELLAMARVVVVEGENHTPSTSGTPLPSSPPSGAAATDDGAQSQSIDSLLRSTLAPAARALISRGVCEFVLVTLGERGAALIGREAEMRAPSAGEGGAALTAARKLFAAARAREGGDSRLHEKLAACVVPAAPVPGGAVVSTGGAGDAFAAGFLAAAFHSGGGSETTAATVEFALAAGAAAAAQVVASPLSSPKLDAERVWSCASEVERRVRWLLTL